jgi:hypothetical protein
MNDGAPLGVDPAAPGPLVHASRDPRALRILAKSVYRELRQSGLTEQDVMAIAGELLSHVAVEVQDRRRSAVPGDRDEPR